MGLTRDEKISKQAQEIEALNKKFKDLTEYERGQAIELEKLKDEKKSRLFWSDMKLMIYSFLSILFFGRGVDWLMEYLNQNTSLSPAYNEGFGLGQMIGVGISVLVFLYGLLRHWNR